MHGNRRRSTVRTATGRRFLTSMLATAVALGALAAPSPVAADTPTADTSVWQQRRVLNIAHAGGDLEAPHETVFAYKRAVAVGTDVLELDVRRSADGVPIVFHDTTVTRTTNASGAVSSYTVAELKALDSGYWFVPNCWSCRDRDPSEYVYRGVRTGETPAPVGYVADDFTVPTVREILELFPDRVLDIEIKTDTPGDADDLAVQLAELLREYDRTDDVVVTAFDSDLVATFSAAAPEVPTSPGVDELTQWFLGDRGPLPHHAVLQVPPVFSGIPVVSEEFVADAHAAGLAVWVWFNGSEDDDTPTHEQLLDWGVDGLITGKPALVQSTLERRGEEFTTSFAVDADRVRTRLRTTVPLTCPERQIDRCQGVAVLLGPRNPFTGWPTLLGAVPVDGVRGATVRPAFWLPFWTQLHVWWHGSLDARIVVFPTNPDTGVTNVPVRLVR